MKRRALLALAGALALAGCGGTPAKDWPDPSPALWHVTGPGGAEGWLFGTIHVLPDGARWRTARLDAALAKSSVLVVEIADLGDDKANQRVFEQLSTTPGQPPLTQRVPAKDRPAIAAFLARAGLGDGDFPQTETWGAAMILANRVRQGDAAIGVDRTLIESSRRVVGLETFVQQYAAFDRLPASEQGDLLLGMAVGAGAGHEDARVREWLTGDLTALEREAAAGVLADPQLREALQNARDRAWAPRVVQLLADGEKPFVAVGTAHMWGPEGLPALLEAKGYTVTRIE